MGVQPAQEAHTPTTEKIEKLDKTTKEAVLHLSEDVRNVKRELSCVRADLWTMQMEITNAIAGLTRLMCPPPVPMVNQVWFGGLVLPSLTFDLPVR